MEFATTDLRARLLAELKDARSADIAVAYFCPDKDTLAALKAVPTLQLVVAADFQVNNPYSLEQLASSQWVRAASPELHGGNLHSKVYLIRRKDTSFWAMVGSANLTSSGLTTNQEACVILDSNDPADADAVSNIRTWMSGMLNQKYEEIDFGLAKAVFDAQKKGGSGSAAASGYWALKPGECGKWWNNFLAESVLSIGWSALPDISSMTDEDAVAAYRVHYPDDEDGAAPSNIRQIRKFIESVGTGDLLLLCGRYDSVGKVDRPAYLYGVARTREVNGKCFFFDAKSKWHRFKRYATIQKIEKALPRSKLIKALGKGSIVPTIQALDATAFTALEKLLRDELAVVLNV